MAFLGREDVIMRLMLEARWIQEGTELCAEEFDPKSEDKACNMEGARPSGRFNVRRAKAGRTLKTMRGLKRRKRRAPPDGPRSRIWSTSEFGFDAIALIRVETKPHPDEVQVIGHEAVSRAEEALAGGGVKRQFAERGVESRIEPAIGIYTTSLSPRGTSGERAREHCR